MAQTGFLNDNSNRDYPLAVRRPTLTRDADGAAVELPTAALLDFHCAVGLGGGWVEGADAVFLHAVRRLGDGRLAFEFRSAASGLAGLALTFVRDPDAAEYAAEVVDAAERAGGSLGAGPAPVCDDDFAWEGTLVTGRLDDLAALLAPGEGLHAADGALPVEPALVQDLAGTYVRAVNLANRQRTLATPPPGCPGDPEAPAGDAVRVAARCLRGALAVRAGYNCEVRQNDLANALTLAAVVGGGAGEPCDEVPAYPGEAAPAGSGLLTGGPACSEVVSSLNGLSAPVVRLVPGSGVRIDPDPDHPHTLIVEFDLRGLAACPAFVDSSH